MTISSSAWGELLYPGLSSIFGNMYRDIPVEYIHMYNKIDKSKRAYETSLLTPGLGLAPEKSKGSSIAYDSASQGWKHSLTHLTYALGFKVEQELMEDDQYNLISKMTRQLARSMRATTEVIGAAPYNNAFSGSYLGGDGVALVSNAHPMADGNTFSNRPSVYSDLTVTSLDQALIDIGNWTNDRGIRIAARPVKLITNISLNFTANRILNSSLDPDSGNNAVNPAKGILEHFASHYISDTNAWFILTDIEDGMKFIWRVSPSFDKDGDFDNGDVKFKSRMRCVAGFNDPRGVYGSQGA